MSAVTEPAVATSAPTPVEEGPTPTPTIVPPESSVEGGSEQEESGDASKSSPGLSPSTWKPNADAAEWKPNFGAPAAPVPGSHSPVAGEGGGAEGREERGKGEEGGAGKEDVDAAKPAAGGEAAVKDSAGTVANGKDGAATEASSPPLAKATGADDVSASKEKNATEALEGDKRYEIDFLLKLRPKPEGTPRPKELTPPGRVDILWDGKEPVAPKASGSIRGGGIRPLPPLGGRMGSRGLGEARGAPPPLRGAQRDMGRDRDGRMDQRGSGGRDDRRSAGSGGGGGRERGGGGGGGRRVVIDTAPALEDCKPIEINEATRWKPKSLEVKDDADKAAAASKLSVTDVLMKANAILNKMTLDKFKKLSVKFMDVALRDPDVVTGVIEIIVEKAQAEPHFSGMYASLCECIARTPIPGLGEDPNGKDAIKGSKKFRKMLLIKVQEEFFKDWQGLFVAVQNDPDLADDEKAEKEFGLKRKYTGHMRFVGELYKVELLREKHVQTAIHDMFGSADDPDEERLECMVKLLQTCGKKLDETGSPETAKDMKRLFKRIGKLADSRQVSSRIRFMLRDLMELRLNRWIPRREEEKAKTMVELHNDIAKEEVSKNRASGRGGGRDARPSGIGSSSSLRPGSGDARVSSGARGAESSSSASRPTSQPVPKTKDEDGWEVVPKKGAKGGGEWSQPSASRSRSSNPGSDERRGNANGGGGSGGSLVAQPSAFALLGSYDEDKEKKKKKKDSKSKKDKEKKASSKDKKKKASKSSSSRSSPTSAPADAPSPAPVVEGGAPSSSTPPTPPAAAGAGTMSEEAARKKGKDTVAEFSVSGELGEACTCLNEITAELRWAAVSEAVTDAMERKQKHRDALGVVLAAGAKDGALTAEALLKGLEDVLEMVPDVCIDVPQAAMYVADAAAPLVLGGHISFAALVGSPCAGLLEGGKAAEFAVLAIVQVKAAAAASGLSKDEADARSAELTGGALDLAKLAAMLPSICRGDEGKATALLERHGVSL